MASKADLQLPPSLLDAWKIGEADAPALDDQLKEYTASQLCKNLLQVQIDRYLAASAGKKNASSLKSMSIHSILDVLESSTGTTLILSDDVRDIVRSLDSSLLQQLVSDPRLSYAALRLLCFAVESEGQDLKADLPNIDEVVLRQERYVRSRPEEHAKFCMRLEHLAAVIPLCSTEDNHVVTIQRLDPPKGGFEILDHWRQKELKVHGSDESFRTVFNHVTEGALRGLDWQNVFMAGGMALACLLDADDYALDVVHPDLDLYLYGLSAEAANAKVEHIYDIWTRNLPQNAKEHLVVKNARTITLLPNYPYRRVQIVLKLPVSPLDVLLNFDLDACAIGFDGARVLMLPRFVRALETGYSIFSMDLIWGHHLQGRRATQETRVFKYADRGFGLRFLPSYLRSLERGTAAGKDLEFFYKHAASEEFDKMSRWYPNGDEPGLKTFKRICYLGKDYVHRYLFGATPLAISPEVMFNNKHEDEEWTKDFKHAESELLQMIKAHNEGLAAGAAFQSRIIHLSDLAGEHHFRNLPDGRHGLGNLEIFMRLCEAWELDARGHAIVDRETTANLIYEDHSYDDQPNYHWNGAFRLDDFREDIETANSRYWNQVKIAIAQKLTIPVTFSGFTNYSSRRLRRHVVADNLHNVMEKQLTIPVAIPFDLEDYILNQLAAKYGDLPDDFHDPTSCLIPLFNENYTHNFIPPMQDTSDERGNLRFWVITNTNMWASQSRTLDELFEIFWAFFHWVIHAPTLQPDTYPISTDTKSCIEHLARSFRRRIVLPEVDSDEELGPGLPTKREALLFRAWALRKTPTNNTDFVGSRRAHKLFFDGAVKWPFDDSLFWKGDEEELGKGK